MKTWLVLAQTGGWHNDLNTLRTWMWLLFAALTLGASPSYALSPKPEFRNVDQVAVQCWVSRVPEVSAVLDAETLCAATAQALRDAMAPKWVGSVHVVRIGAEETRAPKTFTLSVRGAVTSGENSDTLVGLSFAIYRHARRVEGAHLPPAPFVASLSNASGMLTKQMLIDMLSNFMRVTFAAPLLQANPRHP